MKYNFERISSIIVYTTCWCLEFYGDIYTSGHAALGKGYTPVPMTAYGISIGKQLCFFYFLFFSLFSLTVTSIGQIGSNDSPSRQGVNTQYAQVNKATPSQGRQESYRWKESTLLHGHMHTAACVVVQVTSSHFVLGRKMPRHLELGRLDVKQVCRFNS